MPPRTTRKSYRSRVSARTMVGTVHPPCLPVSDTEWRRHRRKMKPLGWEKLIDLSHPATSPISGAPGQKKPFLHYVGWKSEMIRSQERCFFLTSPFIELVRPNPTCGGKNSHSAISRRWPHGPHVCVRPYPVRPHRIHIRHPYSRQPLRHADFAASLILVLAI